MTAQYVSTVLSAPAHAGIDLCVEYFDCSQRRWPRTHGDSPHFLGPLVGIERVPSTFIQGPTG
jgi:hypothetical protein